MKSILSFLIFSLFLVLSCSPDHPYAAVLVSESQGLQRELEYISSQIPKPDTGEAIASLFATESESGTAIPVQIIGTDSDDEGNNNLRIVFPVSIGANESKLYRIDIKEKNSDSDYGKGSLSSDTFHIENETYKVLLSDADAQRGGQINGIILKNFQNQLLERGHISMHWAPNFSKTVSEKYFNLENLKSSSKNETSKGMYQIMKERSGTTDSVPEIDVMGKYTFYEGLPYFHFESTMIMNTDVELDLLRNDEMTMDSLFTHVVFQEKNEKPIHHALYGEDKSIFEGRTITDQADFVAFYHKEKGYGLASIRLLYDNTNMVGNPSPTSKPYTKITASSNNGRYWNRVLSDTIQSFPEGSKYHEKNIYLIFEVDKASPAKEILYYQKRLQNPLQVSVGILE